MCCRNSGLGVSLSPGFLHYYSINQAEKGHISHYSINKENLLHFNNKIYCSQPDSLHNISKTSAISQKTYNQTLSLILSFNHLFSKGKSDRLCHLHCYTQSE